MKTLIYLLQVSACTAIFYLFYRVLLQRLTFFTINRYYLIATLVISFIIPAITIPGNNIPGPVLDQASYEVVGETSSLHTTVIAVPAQTIDWSVILSSIYILSTAILALQFLISLLAFFYKIKSTTPEKVGVINLVRGESAFKNGSFLNYIFLNDAELSKAEAQQILTHEYEHVKRYHSYDKILARASQIILWFNPFSYLYSKAIETNHEFEVDQAVSQNIDKSQYAELIFKLSTNTNGQFYNHFSKFPLKTRLNMLFAKPSKRTRKIVYLLLVPLLLISCIAFANREIIPLKSYKESVKKLRSIAKENISANTESPSSKGSISSVVEIDRANARLSAPAANIINGDPISVINGLEKLGKNPLVEIDGKIYNSSYLYKIGRQCIRGTTLYTPKGAISKYGSVAKDGAVSITTKTGEITYLTAIDIENIKAERKVNGDQIYSTYPVKKEDGTMMYGVKISIPSGGSMSNEVSDLPKVGFMINNRICDKSEFVNTVARLGRLGIGDFGTGPAISYELPRFEVLFWFNTKLRVDTLKTGKNVQSQLFLDLKFSARDSVRVSRDQRFIYLYGKAQLAYKDFTIQGADYLAIDKLTSQVKARSDQREKLQFGMDSKLVKVDSLHFNLAKLKGKTFGLVSD